MGQIGQRTLSSTVIPVFHINGPPRRAGAQRPPWAVPCPLRAQVQARGAATGVLRCRGRLSGADGEMRSGKAKRGPLPAQ